MSIAPMSSTLPTRQPGPISGSGDHVTRHEAAVAIRAALRSGDLDAAKAAFTKLENATSKATAEQSDSSISQLRRALEKGDLGAAKEVLHGAILESRAGKPITKHPRIGLFLRAIACPKGSWAVCST
jgi:hypothetical protein